MNHAKISAIYNAVNYPDLLAYAASGKAAEHSLSEPIAYLVGKRLASMEAGLIGPNGRTYGVNIKNMDSKADLGHDAMGLRIYHEVEAKLTERVHAWAATKLPIGVNHHAVRAAGQDVWSGMVMQYAGEGEKSDMHLAFGAKEDFETLIRGIQAYLRKTAKRTKKVIAQLAAFHAATEKKALRSGHWLGAKKALTTAARLNYPGVPFFGDVEHKQGEQLAYWAVPNNAGMNTHFPAGTGLALKPVTESRGIVDGAVYMWQWQWGKEADQFMTFLGRCDMSVKKRGHLPLRHEGAPHVVPSLWLSWEKPEIKVYRVAYYTTRAEQVVHLMAEREPAQWAELAVAA